MTTIEAVYEKTILPDELFIKKLEEIAGQKAISGRRIWHLADLALIESGNNSGDIILDYFPAIEKAFQMSNEHLCKKGYIGTKKGYIFKN